jgi:hypothetical protein
MTVPQKVGIIREDFVDDVLRRSGFSKSAPGGRTEMRDILLFFSLACWHRNSPPVSGRQLKMRFARAKRESASAAFSSIRMYALAH